MASASFFTQPEDEKTYADQKDKDDRKIDPVGQQGISCPVEGGGEFQKTAADARSEKSGNGSGGDGDENACHDLKLLGDVSR